MASRRRANECRDGCAVTAAMRSVWLRLSSRSRLFHSKFRSPSNGSDRDLRWTTHSEKLTLVAAFANTPLYGGGMKVAPRAKMDDGLLDVCVVGAVGRLKLFADVPDGLRGRHLGIQEVEYFQAAQAAR